MTGGTGRSKEPVAYICEEHVHDGRNDLGWSEQVYKEDPREFAGKEVRNVRPLVDGEGPASNGTDREDYPTEALEALLERAGERFEEQIEKYGEGENWRRCPTGEMAHAARQKATQAEVATLEGRQDDAMTALADALNYVVFETDAERGRHE